MNTADTQALTVPTMDDALSTFRETFNSGWLASDLGSKLTCDELDALTGIFRAAGDDDAANMWTMFHAHHDEPGDAHYAYGWDRTKHNQQSAGCEIQAAHPSGIGGPCPTCEPFASITDADLATSDAAVVAFEAMHDAEDRTR